MKKKSDTQMAFLDLMLCAIGCALMIFTAQVPQPRGRGRGWDDRPFVVRAWATGPRGSQFRWELIREAAKGAGDKGTGATVTPQSKLTASGQPMLFVVPEAEFGAWKLSVVASAEPSGLESLTRDLQGAGAYAEQPEKEVQAHLDLFNRYLTLLESRLQANELDDYLATVKATPQPKAQDIGGFGAAVRVRQDIVTYLKYRRLVMQDALLAKRFPARDNADAKRLAKEISDLLQKPAPPSDKRLQGVLRGIRAEEELRLTLRSGPACKAQDAALVANPRVTSEDVSDNSAYAAYLGEYIRARAIQEHLPAKEKREASAYRATIPSYQANLSATASLGKNDNMFRVIAYEIRALGKNEQPIDVYFGVIWGDKRWPAPEAGQPEDKARPVEKVQLAPGDLWSNVPVATITLPKDRDRPIVSPELR